MNDAKRKPGEPDNRGRAENSEAGNLKKDHSSIVVALPRPGWKIAMARAHAIRRYKGRAKVLAVRHWRVAVVDALEVRT